MTSSAPASDAAASTTRRPRRPWGLQTRLMVAITGIVALILVIIALATSAILGSILQQNLDTQVAGSLSQLRGTPTDTAAQILDYGRQERGTLLIRRTPDGTLSGAYVAANDTVVALDDEQLDSAVAHIDPSGRGTVSIPDIGDYRVQMTGSSGSVFVLVGLPTTEVAATIAQILTTVGLVTAGGLVLLAAAIAAIVRVSLRPLRAVSDTATRVAAVPMSQGEVRITERVPDAESDDRTEIGRVGAALNTLLDHVDASLEARQRNEERMRSFVADASHELRTPLASIRGYSELSLRALRQGDSPIAVESTEQSLERIQAQSLRMTTLVEDLLLLARLDEGQELVYGSVDLSRLAIETVADARVAGPDHSWALDLSGEPVVVAGDEARLHQVAANLLANARTHTPAGTTVTVGVERQGDEAVLRVHDDGPGVDPAIAGELFERFSRADRSRTRQTGGTGLGLSIARAIALAHDGTITVDSRPGDTTFQVRLPARPADDVAAAAEEAIIEPADAATVGEHDAGSAASR